ncbi:alkaline-phosphatase-like protein [Gamsiella multidivaricata]|uniref:alkaline-phosphatase-like protein n=1 Tax=Gamsiella multidivaricata TaxID=101098 RepID=UPI00221F4243|nr:alkaline-phosphatase-like protein [Gamsiella multidivaricata]KAI7831514.1 alkaline-phosphatase-like protein [Gamsiella multidivaricata]
MVKIVSFALLSIATAISAVSALDAAGQFKRLGACPTLGCVFPPDRAEFLAGAHFDVRVEVHAENEDKPNTDYTLTIQKLSGNPKDNKHGGPKAVDFSKWSKIKASAPESWDFSYNKDAAAYWKGQDGDKAAATPVHVASTAWRGVQIKEPGTYKVTLKYNSGKTTEAVWTVNPVKKRKAKNVVLFIGDGMTTAMITAARLISQPHINGKYQKHLNLDQFPVLGHIMTHSLDSLITDSANSASAYNTGHKSSAGALGVYPDSSTSPFDDPKQELLAELLRRRSKKNGGAGGVGIVTTAEVQDATPAAVYAHTRNRDEKATIVDQMIHGANPVVADVILGGGGKYFHSKAGGKSLNGTDYYAAYSKERGYKVVNDKKGLLDYKGSDPLLGIFHSSNMDVWMDRNVYKNNLNKNGTDPTGNGLPALNQPNLDDMVIKGLEILDKRHRKEGWFLMAEAASVDKMMHPLDYDRALADLLELDKSVGKTKEWLKRNKLDKDTLVLVTADHGHSFDVYGSVDTQYFNSFSDSEELEKKNSVGTYENSGWPSYVDADGDGFPDQWDVRYTLAAGTAGFPAHREDFQVNINGTRVPAVPKSNSHHHYQVYEPNPDDAPHGITKSGTLGTTESVGVHSLQDVPIFASGPGSHLFAGIQDNTEIFHKISELLGLGEQN